MAQKPDFMKAVRRVGQQMEQTAQLHNSKATANETEILASATQGFEQRGAVKTVRAPSAASRTSATIYMDHDLFRRFKILAALEDRKLNQYFLEAVDDYVAKIGDRLPKL